MFRIFKSNFKICLFWSTIMILSYTKRLHLQIDCNEHQFDIAKRLSSIWYVPMAVIIIASCAIALLCQCFVLGCVSIIRDWFDSSLYFKHLATQSEFKGRNRCASICSNKHLSSEQSITTISKLLQLLQFHIFEHLWTKTLWKLFWCINLSQVVKHSIWLVDHCWKHDYLPELHFSHLYMPNMLRK